MSVHALARCEMPRLDTRLICRRLRATKFGLGTFTTHARNALDGCGKLLNNRLMIPASHWLKTDFHTLFQTGADGRIVCENDPGQTPGPRFWLAGCAETNLCATRADLSDGLVAELERLAASEPRFVHPNTPVHLERYLSLLGGDGPAEHNFGLVFELPHDTPYQGDARLVGSDSEEGAGMMRGWATDGIPKAWFDLGFRELADFWTPWCAAIVDGEVASLAFAARLADTGAELGLVTAKAFRGRGFGAAATAGWSQLPTLRSRTLFYSTDRDNVSSQRVAARLGLRLRGASLRIS